MLRYLLSIATAVEWMIIAWIGLMVMGVFNPAGAEDCDCTHVAYEALKRSGVKLATVPAIVWTLEPTHYARGVVWIRPNAPCSVYVHELAHHDQYLHGKEAKQQFDADWWALEHNAKALEQRAMEYAGVCL